VNLDAIRELAKKNLAGRRPNGNREAGYIYYHSLRVANLAGELSARTGAPSDEFDPVLYTGALFHDVGKGLSRHNETGAAVARELLSEHLGEDVLAEVCDIVRFHCVRKHGLDLSRRVLLVQDADIIDHYGSQQVWLQFLQAAFNNVPQPDVAGRWTAESYRSEIERVRALINLEESLRIFDERVSFQREFYRRFQEEALRGVFEADGQSEGDAT